MPCGVPCLVLLSRSSERRVGAHYSEGCFFTTLSFVLVQLLGGALAALKDPSTLIVQLLGTSEGVSLLTECGVEIFLRGHPLQHGQRVISVALCNIVWQPFSSEHTL
jgi:hypothetical protein